MTKKVKVSQPGLFGGSWTPEKLRCLQNYLKAYCQIFKKGSRGAYFETTYVDAFAGTGYLEVQDLEMPLAQFFPVEFEGLARSAAEYAKGSAVRALEVEPGFDKFLSSSSVMLIEQLSSDDSWSSSLGKTSKSSIPMRIVL